LHRYKLRAQVISTDGEILGDTGEVRAFVISTDGENFLRNPNSR